MAKAKTRKPKAEEQDPQLPARIDDVPAVPVRAMGAAIAPAMSVSEIVEREKFLDDLAEKVLHLGKHFGVIPGCGKKPSLFKAGAEKLARAFGLRKAAPEIKATVTEDGVTYTITQALLDGMGNVVATGLGACSSAEEKYRWRKASQAEYDNTPTDQRRVKYYASKEVLQVHTNPADVNNTVLKMAEKRAYNQAVLYATGTSDRFTVDIEDMPHVQGGGGQADSEWLPFDAKYEKTCAECGGRIKVGEPIFWHKQTKAVKHRKCPHQPQQGGETKAEAVPPPTCPECDRVLTRDIDSNGNPYVYCPSNAHDPFDRDITEEDEAYFRAQEG